MPDLQVIESKIWKELEMCSTAELEGLVDIHFSWSEDASEDFIKDFYTRQHVAQRMLDKRLGRSENRDPSYVWRDKSEDPSIWSRPYSSPENSS